jgi:hypothetical protein
MNQQFYTPGTSPLRKVVTIPLDRLEEMHGLNRKFPALAKGREKKKTRQRLCRLS